MAFRDELDAARARAEALEAEVAAAKKALAEAPKAKWEMPMWAIGALAIAALGTVLGGSALLVTLPNHEETLVWRGTLLAQARDQRPGASCVLRATANTQFGEVLVGEWKVVVQCGRRVLYERDEACCTDEKGSVCRLDQRRRSGVATYGVECTDAPLHVKSERRELRIERARGAPISIDLEPRSAEVMAPLFDADGPHFGFGHYAPSD